MAFSDLEEELENLRNGQDVFEIHTFDDEGDLLIEHSGLGMDWLSTSQNSVIGSKILSAGEDVRDALKWVLQGKQTDNQNIWRAAEKLGLDLYALGVNSSRRDFGFKESTAPTQESLGKLKGIIGVDKVTRRVGESDKEFRARRNDPSNWDVMGRMGGHYSGDLLQEYLVGSGENAIPVTSAIKILATGYHDKNDYSTKAEYNSALDKTARQLQNKLPFALKEQAAFYAIKTNSDSRVGYAAVLPSLGLGEFDRGAVENLLPAGLTNTLKGIANVFNARGTNGEDWHNLTTGLQSWMQPASNYQLGDVLNELAYQGNEGSLTDLVDELGLGRGNSFDPQLIKDTIGIDSATLNSIPIDKIADTAAEFGIDLSALGGRPFSVVGDEYFLKKSGADPVQDFTIGGSLGKPLAKLNLAERELLNEQARQLENIKNREENKLHPSESVLQTGGLEELREQERELATILAQRRDAKAASLQKESLERENLMKPRTIVVENGQKYGIYPDNPNERIPLSLVGPPTREHHDIVERFYESRADEREKFKSHVEKEKARREAQKAAELEARREAAKIGIPFDNLREGDESLIIHNDPQGTPEWKKARDPMLTAADAHIANPNSKYGASALKRKWDTVTGDNSIESRYNSNFERGHSKEGLARSWYEKQYGTPVAEVGLIENPEYQGIGASVDGLIGRDGLFEAKAPARKFSEITKDHAYYAQVQMQMAVTNREWADLVQIKEKDRSVFGKIEHEYKVDRIKRDEGFIRSNMPKWQAHGQNFRIASGQATTDDEIFMSKQEEYSNWWNKALDEEPVKEAAARREAFGKSRRAEHLYNNNEDRASGADFERRLLERAKSPEASANLKDTMKSALIEADEEIQKKRESSLLGQAGAVAGATLGFMGGLAGKGLGIVGGLATPFGRAFGSAGQGDYLGAVANMTSQVPVVGALIGGSITAVKGQLDKATEVADIVGMAKEMGISYNALNSTQQMGVALGISKQDSTRMISTTTSAAAGMSTGNMDEAAKIVVETRGYIGLADIQAYGDDPLQLARVAKQRMAANGLTERQQADLLRRANLGSANRLEGASEKTRENLAIAATSNEMDGAVSQELFDNTGRANSAIGIARNRPIIGMAEEGQLEKMLDGVVKVVDFVEESFSSLAKAAINSSDGLGKLGQHIKVLLKLAGADEQDKDAIPHGAGPTTPWGQVWGRVRESFGGSNVHTPTSAVDTAPTNNSIRVNGVIKGNLKPSANKLATSGKDFPDNWTEPLDTQMYPKGWEKNFGADWREGGRPDGKILLNKTPASVEREGLEYLQGLRKSGIDPLTNKQYDKTSLSQLDRAIEAMKIQSKVEINMSVSDNQITATAKQDGKQVASAASNRK